ncbi:NTF2-like protein [Mollisia scopiformis]|uniref:NTF2-like protein n=1 Tax=Mollisia scopiformis TaxID=149040 RepID=A0A194XMW7_MOLSC|nr:NTF2-like protein [Mollisia scopiformis]KUJ21471.1 NTF2-like protein [Mollisia scopiformis]
MTFDIYIPSNLTFQDYLAVCQCARTLADGYDRKDKSRVRASLAPNIIVDYSLVVPAWGEKHFAADAFVEEWLGPNHLGVKALATQHLLGIPYFKSVTDEEIVVEWQQMASHGRRVEGEDYASPMCKIGEISDGRSWMKQTFVKVEGSWRIRIIRPEVLYHTGDFLSVGRPDHGEDIKPR